MTYVFWGGSRENFRDCPDEHADFSTSKTHHSAITFMTTAVEAITTAPEAAVISVILTDISITPRVAFISVFFTVVTAAPRVAVMQVVFTAIIVVLAIGIIIGAVADNSIPSSHGLGIFREVYSD